MTINVETQILDHRGNPLIENEKPLILGELLCNYCLVSHPSFEDSVEQKTLAFKIARRCGAALDGDSKEVNLSIQELAFLKTKIGSVAPPLAFGAVMSILDPDGAEWK